MKKCLLPMLLLGLVGTSNAQDTVKADSPLTLQNPQTLQKLRNNSGITIQWIGWESRGIAVARDFDGQTYLSGGQIDDNGPGTLWMDGKITESGDDYFIFEGLIRISNSPEVGRVCEGTKKWRFAITQNRKYYRLREFEWCDGLTDYIDIYF